MAYKLRRALIAPWRFALTLLILIGACLFASVMILASAGWQWVSLGTLVVIWVPCGVTIAAAWAQHDQAIWRE